ncbi:MAG: phosphotransferase [Chitinophagaceae bacterium]
MKRDIIEKAAIQFGNGAPVIEPIGDGLIHRTFKVTFTGNDTAIVLQCINQRTFSQPENIIQNYQMLYGYLEGKQGGVKIPALVPTHQKKIFWVDAEDNFWKATRFINNSHSLSVAKNEKDAYQVAKSFAGLTNSLTDINQLDLYVIIPDFHNLFLRYQQFEEAVSQATVMRLLRSTHLISELRQRKKLVAFYNSLNDETIYPTRLMHHDCKINNILFDENTGAVLCPVDLDTVMPGKFFSDLGDMIRTLVSPVNENSTAWEEIGVRSEYYFAIICGYLDGVCHLLTKTEKVNLHYSGLLMTYMQSMRFVTDFLNNDIYYKTSYPEQNLNRALNQFILLEQLEEFLEKKYHFRVDG